MNAIAGTFSDIKTVKTRGVVQMVIEVPIERADDALKVLGGVPQPGKERWVGIAPIPDQERGRAGAPVASPSPAPDAATPGGGKPEGAAPVPKPRARWQDMAIATRAGIMCSDARSWPVIQAVMERAPGSRGAWNIDCAGNAAEALRLYCGVESRADIINDRQATRNYHRVESEYLAAIGRIARLT